MSTYEWEAGTITLPSKDWAGLRKGLLAAWNQHLDTVLATAKRAHKAAVAAGKGKRGDNRQKAMKAAVAKVCGGRIGEWGGFEGGQGGNDRHNETYDLYETVTGLIWNRTYNRETRRSDVKFQSPQKKGLPYTAISKDACLQLGEASVTFRNANRSVHWDVPENNHACEAARDHWFAGKLFAALGRITFTRGTGGTIMGNNEYNEDENGHRGDRYVVATYRPETAADRRRKAERARQASHSYGYGGYGRRY